MTLVNYNFIICCKPGKHKLVADALSQKAFHKYIEDGIITNGELICFIKEENMPLLQAQDQSIYNTNNISRKQSGVSRRTK